MIAAANRSSKLFATASDKPHNHRRLRWLAYYQPGINVQSRGRATELVNTTVTQYRFGWSGSVNDGYEAQVWASYPPHNDSCRISWIQTGGPDLSLLQQRVNHTWPIGSVHRRYRRYGTHICLTHTDMQAIGIAGIVFLGALVVSYC